MPAATASWRKLSTRLGRLQKSLPGSWKHKTPKSAKVIVRNLEDLVPKFKGQYVISTVYDAKRGHSIDIKAKPGSAHEILRHHFGTPGVEHNPIFSGRGPFPIYWESQEDRERVLQELLAEESEWIAGGKKGDDKHVSKHAEWKLVLEGVIIRYGPFKGRGASRFIEKAVANSLMDITKLYSHPIVKIFEGL